MANISFRTTIPTGLAFDWSDGANWNTGFIPSAGDNVTVSSGLPNEDLFVATDDIASLVLGDVAVTDLGAILNISETASLFTASIHNDSLINVSGNLVAFDVVNSGNISVADGGVFVGLNFSGGGQVSIREGGRVALGELGVGGVQDQAFNSQTFELRGGLLDIEAPVGGATFNFLGATHSHFEISVDAATGLTPSNTFAALGAGDFIELAGNRLTGFTFDAGTLTLNAGATSFNLNIASFEGGANSFIMTTDALTGNSAVQVACFLRGTRFAAQNGEVAIEDLRIGDLLHTAGGASRPIKWIGRRRYSRAAAANPDIRPVLVKRGALAGNVPSRDLHVSPHHALYLDGNLVEARLLTNGVSIIDAEVEAAIEYFNIELETHDVILAEGAEVESFIDCQSRDMFENVAEYRALYPDVEATTPAFCAPRIEDGMALEVLRRKLRLRAGRNAARAPSARIKGNTEKYDWSGLLGWAFDPANPELPVRIDIFVDGVRTTSVVANRYRHDLRKAGLGAGRCGFEAKLPLSLDPTVPHLVRLVVAGTQTDLRGSPALLQAIPGLSPNSDDTIDFPPHLIANPPHPHQPRP